jgi:endoglucanase
MQRFAFLTALPCVLALAAHASAADADIRLSSLGYLPLRAKLAAVVQPAAAFSVVRDSDGAVVLTGPLTGPVNDADTGESVLTADFSALAEPGTYHLEVDGVGRSVSFPVDADAYRGAFETSMLGFYGWRCGTAVSFDYAGTHFGYPACHLQDAHTEPLGGTGVGDGLGGWHDAGDYGKYTVNSALTVAVLLAAWEDYQAVLAPLRLQIPETGGALPDFLAEVKWELLWMLKMQYSPTDGRVSHKITEASHPGFVMPQADTGARSFVPYGTGATADFAAVLAKASRAYRPYDAAFADRCLAAARLSYEFLNANPGNVAPAETGFIGTQYASSDTDDRLWAAAEIWAATGDSAALSAFETALRPPTVSVDFDWPSLANLGVFTYLGSAQAGRDPGVLAGFQSALVSTADTLVRNHRAGGYGRALTNYYWGVNGSLARTCMVLSQAYRVAANPDYIDTCADQLAFLFGRNPFNRSLVTGLGHDPPLHIHHRPSAADGIDAPYPGLLVGGGWAYREIAGPPVIPACTLPEGLCWSDDQNNYMTNEVAINWNAALVYALATFVGGGVQVPTRSGSGAAGGAGAAGAAGAAGSASVAGTGGAGASGGGGGDSHPGSKGACGCRVGGVRAEGAGWVGVLALLALVARRRGHRASRTVPV